MTGRGAAPHLRSPITCILSAHRLYPLRSHSVHTPTLMLHNEHVLILCIHVPQNLKIQSQSDITTTTCHQNTAPHPPRPLPSSPLPLTTAGDAASLKRRRHGVKPTSVLSSAHIGWK